MPQLNYSLDSAISNLPLAPSELVDRYFFGIPVVDQSGNVMSEDSLTFYIQAAAEEVEGFLNLKLTKQVITERLNYTMDDYKAWGFIPTSFPVLKAHSLGGFVGTIQQVTFPPEWLSIKMSSDPTAMHRSVYLIPSGGTTSHNSVVFNGISPHLGWFSLPTIPNYWEIKYCTSFKAIPADLLDFIGKLAAINIFHQLGDIILGAGIASQSIGIDGLSQSISTTSSATNAGYGARIGGYLDDLKRGRDMLKNKYDGMILSSL